jgi:ribosome biogenesis GTPase / thiamine phosphate phosphatase
VNALVGTTVMQTQAIRRADGRGRHTTTYRALIPLPGGGAILDTPGIKGVGMFDAEDGIASTFADIETLAASCRFDDCRHEQEPGCAVREALVAGEVPPRRLDSFRKLHRELEDQTRRSDVRLSRPARRPRVGPDRRVEP